MTTAKAMAKARRFAEVELGLAPAVVATVPNGDGWRVTLEAVVEADYMRQRAQRDLVAVYELQLDADLMVVAFERKEIRERGTTTPLQ